TATLVILGTLVFIYFRAVKHESRMTLSGEGLLILGIIMAMMLADIVYDGASLVLWHRYADMPCAPSDTALCDKVQLITAHFGGPPEEPLHFRFFPDPAGSFAAMVFDGAGREVLTLFAQIGFWTHSTLVLLFANLLPHSKHFHIITGIPNAFARDITRPGRLPLMAASSEKIGEMVMKAAEEPEHAEPVGASKIEDFTWKAILDFYTCTDCR